jgi:hypothetical protein
MHKRVFCAAIGLALMTAMAAAQSYPRSTTAAVISAPEMGASAPGTSTTTIAPGLYGGPEATTTRIGLDAFGNPITTRDIYREGIAGSSQSHPNSATDPRAGGSTAPRSSATTNTR